MKSRTIPNGFLISKGHSYYVFILLFLLYMFDYIGRLIVVSLFPEKKRSVMVGIWNASIPVGSAIGVALGGFIAVKYGWRNAFGLVAIPGMIISILFFFIKDYKTVDLIRSGKGEKDGSGNPMKMSKRDIISPSF